MVAAITVACSALIPTNVTTVGFAYLIAVLIVATGWGLFEALSASLLSMLCFNFFFFPPTGTFTIADPQNWVALFAFLATSVIASQLSARAKQRAQEALDRRTEMERLYALSRAILLADANTFPGRQIAQRIQEIFEVPGLALFDRLTGEVHGSGFDDRSGIDERLRQAAVRETPFCAGPEGVLLAPIRLAGQSVGSLAIRGANLSYAALEALANLVAVALERVRAQEAATRAEAARQSDELKSTLLDAIAHEFNTPLTSIRAAATALLSDPVATPEEHRELVTIVDEEAKRLGRLVNEAIRMARIEAGKIQLNRTLQSVPGVIEMALGPMTPLTEGRKISLNLSPDLPLIRADGELTALAVRQLLDNALKYSPPASPISISAEWRGGEVTISVCDQGPGIPEGEQSKIFEKFYRGPAVRQRVAGVGLGLAVACEIARAHGGSLRVESRAGNGSRFCLSVPAVFEEESA